MTLASVPVNSQPPAQATPLVPNGAPVSTTATTAFQNILDTINPLEHIPVLSSLYRSATGSSISTGSQVAGDTAYGMLLGGGAVLAVASSLGTAAANAVSTHLTGSNASTAVSSITPSNATPLVADSGQAAIANAVAASHQALTPQFFPLGKNPVASIALYDQANIEGTVQKNLVHMGV